ncbi:MAG TPA: hypothetical protein VN026_09855 [Bacteroidia bacterium]|jgi:hypothetical protein|nr:hypothetical protein [Bacteroidia bacterium]
MLANLKYSKKCLIVFGGFALFLIIAYKLSFSETLKNRSEIKEKEGKISWLKEKEKEIPFLKSKMELIEKTCQKGDSSSVRVKLTEFISDYAENNNCLVTEIPFSSSYKNGTVNVETNSFTIKGTFNSLLRLQYTLGKEFKFIAKIMSARFFSLKENQTKRKNLYLTVITQSFSQTHETK